MNDAAAKPAAVDTAATVLRLDPDNATSINNRAVAELDTGNALWAAARLREGILSMRRAADDFGRASAGGAVMSMSHFTMRTRAALFQILVGDLSGATATVAAGGPLLAKWRKSEPPGGLLLAIGENMETLPAAVAAAERDELATAQRLAGDAASRIGAATTRGDSATNYKAVWVAVISSLSGRIEYRLGNFAAAEKAEGTALAARRIWGEHTTTDQRDLAEMSTWLAMAQARQGRMSDAAQTIAPVVKLQRELAARNHGDQWVPLELARALYAESLTDPARSAALLREAAKLVDGLAPTIQPLHDTRLWREWIRQAQRGAV